MQQLWQRLRVYCHKYYNLCRDFIHCDGCDTQYRNGQKYRFLVLALLLLALLFYGLIYMGSGPVAAKPGQVVEIVVKPGSTAQSIGEQLEKQGVVKSAFAFRIIARLQGDGNQLKAGIYQLSTAYSCQEIIQRLKEGKGHHFKVTIPEGYTVKQIAALLQDKQLGTTAGLQQALYNNRYGYDDVPDRVVSPASPLEGYLFPDTYEVSADMSEQQVVAMMLKRFHEVFTAEMLQQARAMNLTEYQVLTLASLVEREAQVDAERPVIASVFLNRLSRQMPLQSCASVQYILGDPKAQLSIEDTKIESPYNTYLHVGLPPGPIANPGLLSIQAVLHPAQTDYLYFLTRDDHIHVFSRTYEEHLAAMK